MPPPYSSFDYRPQPQCNCNALSQLVENLRDQITELQTQLDFTAEKAASAENALDAEKAARAAARAAGRARAATEKAAKDRTMVKAIIIGAVIAVVNCFVFSQFSL